MPYTYQELEDAVDNMQITLQEQADAIVQMQETLALVTDRPGQLAFPLDQDTISLIKELFPTGTATLIAGIAVVQNEVVASDTKILLSVQTALGTPGVAYISAQSSGTFTITSTSASDTSVINYLIL